MVKPPNKVLSECYKQAEKWTEDLVKKENMTLADRRILAYAYNNKCYVMPYKKTVGEAIKAGYGPKKAEKWLHNWYDAGLISWSAVDFGTEIVCFKENAMSWLVEDCIVKILSDQRAKEAAIMQSVQGASA